MRLSFLSSLHPRRRCETPGPRRLCEARSARRRGGALGSGLRLAVPVWFALAGLSALVPAGCLPTDERPAPGVVKVWLEAGEGVEQRRPFVTADGWLVTFERVLISSQGVRERTSSRERLADGGGECDLYYETSLQTLYDVVAPGPKILGRLAGLGRCRFGPSWNRFDGSFDLLGPGVSADDMQRALADLQSEGPAGFFVVGTASKGVQSKTFAWPFSLQFFDDSCDRDAPVFRADLKEGDDVDFVVTLRPDRLLFDRLEGSSGVRRFDVIAAADDEGAGNADGVVSLEELGAVSLAQIDQLAQGDGSSYRLSPGRLYPAPTPTPGSDRPSFEGPSLLSFLSLQVLYSLHDGQRSLCVEPPPGRF
jgi:hypothetical protein